MSRNFPEGRLEDGSALPPPVERIPQALMRTALSILCFVQNVTDVLLCAVYASAKYFTLNRKTEPVQRRKTMSV